MTYQDVREAAKKSIGPRCRVCPECNGVACRGEIPGPGGKGTGMGFIRNYQEIKKIRLVMDTMYAPRGVTTETKLFGKSFKFPVFAAPIGAISLHYNDTHDDKSYAAALVSACAAEGSAAFTGDGPKDPAFFGPLEAIRAAGGIGVPTIKPWNVREVIERAKHAQEAGVFALAMDIDAAGLTVLAAMGKPVFPMPQEAVAEIVASLHVPFILKGVMTPEGARKAVAAGAQGIVVSNHGGRVLDETPSTIEVLPGIVEAVGGKTTILIDGGFRTGLDVFKALALGADGVLIGRPFVYAAFGGGAEGVALYLRKVRAELEEAMLMTGASRLSEIDASKVSMAT